MKSRLSLLGLLLWLLMPSTAWSQASVYMCVELTSGIDRCQHVSVANPLPVTGSFSATTNGFHEESVQTPITATTGGVSSAAFTAGKVVVVTNAGTTNIAYCQLGAAATTSGQPIAPNGGWFAFTSTSETLVTCATSTSTTTVNFAVGTGLPTGTGGGGGSSGGGAITAADGAIVTIGAVADSAWVSGNGTLVALLKNIAAGVAGSIPAGTAEIGNVKNSGTFAVQAASTLAAETTKVIGTVRNADGAGVLYVSDPCSTAARTTLPITLATAAVKVIATGVSAKKIYVCHLQLTNNAADSIALFEATTGTTCVTSPIAVVGAGTSVATAATGYNFFANGGINTGTGNNQVHLTTVNNNDLCIAQSAATQLTGTITYVTQ